MSEQKSRISGKIKERASRRQQRLIRMGSNANVGGSRQMPVAYQLVSGLIVLIAVGTALLMLPGTATRKLSLMDALFTSTSAAAVTGLSLFPVSTDLTLWGQLILLLLVQIGGVGLIVIVVLVFRLIGRQVTLGERLAVTSSLGLDRPEQIALHLRDCAFGRARGDALAFQHLPVEAKPESHRDDGEEQITRVVA